MNAAAQASMARKRMKNSNLKGTAWDKKLPSTLDTAKLRKVPGGLSGILELCGIPGVEGGESAFALDAAALFLIANFLAEVFFERFQ